jgi:hypothetical protein
MKNYKYILVGFLSLAIFYSCKKNETSFKDFFNGSEITYTGAVSKVIVQPGNLKLGLKWKASTDPSIVKYVIYYNNRADSQVVAVTEKVDTIRTVIPNLGEFTYSFTIFSYDAKGNKSIPVEVNNAKVYGPTYTSKLLNRGYSATESSVVNDDGYLQLNFIEPDTINVNTVIKYTNKSNVLVEKVLLANQSSIALEDYKVGTEITYRSSYKPERNALEAFVVSGSSVFPPHVYQDVQCNKSLFKEAHLPNDVQTYESGTSISKLWDGSVGPQGYPNIFHSDGSYIPHVLTFDMGKTYRNLSKIEETGRDCCNNPDRFEVWGINDLTNASTTLRSDNSGWKDEAIANVWFF